jgi:hypothetical protein
MPASLSPQLVALLPLLEHVSASTDPHLADMARALRVTIIARDPSWADAGAAAGATGRCCAWGGAYISAAARASGVDITQVLAELRDPLPPVRAQALATLRKVCQKSRFGNQMLMDGGPSW